MNTDQIAAEAAETIRGLKYPNLEGIIQIAIERARQEGYKAGYRDGGFAALGSESARRQFDRPLKK